MSTPSFRVHAGGPGSSVILHVPHSATGIPADVREGLLLSREDLAAELAHLTDAHTESIAVRAAEMVTTPPWLFVNQLSRLVVDPERLPDDREEMVAVGMGAVYTRTSHGEPLRAQDRQRDEGLRATYFGPYAAALADLVDARIEATGQAVIIDVHSYPSRPLPYELHAGDRRPAVCLGVDDDHTPAYLRRAAESAFAAIGEVGTNEPFSGTYVPLRHYRRDDRVHSIMIEIRRDTYMTEPGGATTAGVASVTRTLANLVSVLAD